VKLWISIAFGGHPVGPRCDLGVRVGEIVGPDRVRRSASGV